MRTKLNLTIEKDVADRAKEYGLNMSRITEDALREATRKEYARRWAEENKDAIEAHRKRVEKEGLPFAEFRRL